MAVKDDDRGAPDDGAEWPDSLDVNDLLESGWRPTPFQQFVLKIHSRCNLACDYCYMYEMADQSWRRQPRRMAKPTIDRVARRIAEHADANGLDHVELILHGGEPLLAGVSHLTYALETFLSTIGPDVRVSFQIQTNGVLLDQAFLELFRKHFVRVGVSLDGDQEGHDRHRTRPGGRGSFADVSAGLARLRQPSHRHLFSGLLATVDLRNDPVLTYEALLAHEPPAIDFLLPHGHWDAPPPGRPPDTSTPYADWLIAIFDRWYGAKVQETRIRLFGQIMRLLLGRPSLSEAVGLSPVVVAVVETDGSIEQVDTLKSAFAGATTTPLHVYRDGFDAALLLPSFAARQIGARALAGPCLSCPERLVCGGGLYPHRYRAGSGFAGPSVYCHDLFRLITHIRSTLAADLAAMAERKSADGATPARSGRDASGPRGASGPAEPARADGTARPA